MPIGSLVKRDQIGCEPAATAMDQNRPIRVTRVVLFVVKRNPARPIAKRGTHPQPTAVVQANEQRILVNGAKRNVRSHHRRQFEPSRDGLSSQLLAARNREHYDLCVCGLDQKPRAILGKPGIVEGLSEGGGRQLGLDVDDLQTALARAAASPDTPRFDRRGAALWRLEPA